MAVFHDAVEVGLRGLFHEAVEFFNGGVTLGRKGQIDDRTCHNGDTEAHAGEDAFHFGQNFANGFGGTRS